MRAIMKADDAIALVREWRRYNYAPLLPSAVVIAEPNWLAYVQAMAASMPNEDFTYPTEEDVLWAWPDGVLVVLAEPMNLAHTIVSVGTGGRPTSVEPHLEDHYVAGLSICGRQPIPTQYQGLPNISMGSMEAFPTIWIGADPTDIVQGHWLPGTPTRPAIDMISQSTLLLVSIITAMGHRLTRIAEPATRGERRRAQRDMPGLRVLELASGAAMQRGGNTGSVEWSRRWMVRGHWRLQPHGPERSLRKAIWIDPHVKGPEDKPLDVRETIWKRR